jgi:hypothetical protein
VGAGLSHARFGFEGISAGDMEAALVFQSGTCPSDLAAAGNPPESKLPGFD